LENKLLGWIHSQLVYFAYPKCIFRCWRFHQIRKTDEFL